MYQTIIAATDLSQTAQSAIDAAAALAGHFGAKLILLHVYQLPIVPFTDAALMPPTDYLGEVMRESDRRLEEMRAELQKKGLTVEIATRTGGHADEIVAGAHELKADLLVISTHGRTGLRRLAMGSVAEVVLRHADIPVLVTRAKPNA